MKVVNTGKRWRVRAYIVDAQGNRSRCGGAGSTKTLALERAWAHYDRRRPGYGEGVWLDIVAVETYTRKAITGL